MPEIREKELARMRCLLGHGMPDSLMGKSSSCLSGKWGITTFFFHHTSLFGPRAEATFLRLAINLSAVRRHRTVCYKVYRAFVIWTSTGFHPILISIEQGLCMPIRDLLIRA